MFVGMWDDAVITRSGICQIIQHLVKYHKLLVRSLLKRNIEEFRDVFFEGEGRI